MCLVVINNELKQRCCNCNGLCKREPKRAAQISRINEADEAANFRILLLETTMIQQQQDALQQAG